ncbi:MAG TPA: hypothetical protein VIY48_03680 [Candidatus Paceibacterota bacterium]|jgi:transcription initiation factor IIE alpha subunit
MATKERREELIARMIPMGEVAYTWIQNLKDGACPLCGADINEDDFRDQISRDEFELSHMCQACQDVTFAKPSDE